MSSPTGTLAILLTGVRVLRRTGVWFLGRTLAGLRSSVRIAHRLRYVPLALAALGAIMVTFGPKARVVVKKPTISTTTSNRFSTQPCCHWIPGGYPRVARKRSGTIVLRTSR